MSSREHRRWRAPPPTPAGSEEQQSAEQSRQISKERVDVVLLIASSRHAFTALEVAQALGITPMAALTRISRMQAAGQIQRVAPRTRPARYQLPAQLTVEDLLAGARIWDRS
jgi:hypothetical protein